MNNISTLNHSPEPHFGYFIGRTLRILKKSIHRSFEEAGHDVTVEQMGVLFMLWHHQGGVSQREIVTMLCKAKSSVTRLIDNMEKRNLVVRVADKEDKRNKIIHLTHKGKTLQAELEIIVQQTIKVAQGDISDQKMQLCKEVLTGMYENLSEEDARYHDDKEGG